MALKDDLEAAVAKKFREQWTTREGVVVPDESSINLGNDGVFIDATVLYADLADSTKLVDTYPAEFAAEVYGTFLNSSSRIIRAHGGTITAFDGDRVMAIYVGADKEIKAVRTALRINKAVSQIIRPTLRSVYPKVAYELGHTVGVDSSRLLAVKDGIRGANDMIWVGKAANHAAKLCALPHQYSTRITAAVYGKLDQGLRVTITGEAVWEPVTWTDMDNAQIYRTTCVMSSF